MKKKTFKLMSALFMSFTIFSSNLLAAENSKGVVTQTRIAYKTPEINSEAVCYVTEGETLVVVEDTENYYGLLLDGEEVVYVEKEYILKEIAIETTLEEQFLPIEKEEEIIKAEPVVSKGKQVADYAKQFIGTPYRSGGTDLNSGVDCSGYTTAIYKKFGINLARSSGDQYATNGTKVSKTELQEGDLVFYGYNGRVNHVAIYIGNDKIVHSTVPGSNVKITPITQRGMAPIIGYKRLV